MTTLADLFPEGPRRLSNGLPAGEDPVSPPAAAALGNGGASASARGEQEAPRIPLGDLGALLGTRRAPAPAVAPADDAPALTAMVAQAAAQAVPVAYAPAASSKRRRGQRRVDKIGVALAALAVVVVAVTGAVVGVRAAQASPTSGALEALSSEEAALESARGAFVASESRLRERIAEGEADADALGSAVVAAGPVSEPGAQQAMLTAIETYRAGLKRVTLPTAPPVYVRGAVDETSLASVSAAVDEVYRHSTRMNEALAEVRAVRTEVDRLDAAFLAATTAFTGSFPGLAVTVVAANPEAEQSFRDAVTVAANALAVAPGQGTAAVIDGLAAYQVAVTALVADEARAVAAREEAEANANTGGSGGGSGGGGGGGTTPVDPQPDPQPEPEPEPEPQPEPEPEPIDPVDPAP